MCGIIAYLGPQDCYSILIQGLKRLEYRGYDSWGVAIKNNEKIFLKKMRGKINTEHLNIKGTLGIAHTRWATHGAVTEKNSHPHHDYEKKVFAVHNGIIENYEELRKKIKKPFYSETDSEVIPCLIAKFLEDGEDFEKAILKTCKLMKGNFAFVATNRETKELGLAKKGSPLAIGFNREEFFTASDIVAFSDRAEKHFFLDDEEITIINAQAKEKIKLIDFSGKPLKYEKKLKKTSHNYDEIMLGQYEHYMHKEIHEQPNSIKETYETYYHKEFLFEKILGTQEQNIIKNTNRIIIIGCGTSWHSGLTAEYWLEKLAKIPVEVEYASEFRYRETIIEKNTLIIAISQSGETADTIAAINKAKKQGAKILSITNTRDSTIDRLSHITLYTRAGREIGVASTKAFTTQLTVLFLLTLYYSKQRKTISKKEIKKYLNELQKIPKLIEDILSKEKYYKKIIQEYSKKNNALFLGRGVNYPIALEGALKLKEISYIHAEGYPAAEMKHGPIALIDKNMPSVFICVKDSSYEKIISNMEEVKARDGKIIAIATKGDNEIKRKANHTITIPETLDELTPLLTTIPLQILAYGIAKRKKCEIDKPRNLAKSVTVE